MKTPANYIETVYGTHRFAMTLVSNDAEQLMDLMQEFSDYNSNELQKDPELLKALQKLMYIYDAEGHLLNFNVEIARAAINKALGLTTNSTDPETQIEL